MFKKLSKNNEGIVFVTVLVIIISMMILATAVINIQLNQTLVSEREIKRIQREMLATGALNYYLANQFSTSPGNNITLTEVVGNSTYTITIKNGGAAGMDIEVE